jgi:hypothetical protein
MKNKIKGGASLVKSLAGSALSAGMKAAEKSPYGMAARAAGIDTKSIANSIKKGSFENLSKMATNVGKASIAQSGSNPIANLTSGLTGAMTSGLTGAMTSATQNKSSTQSPTLSQSSALAQLSTNDANNLKKSFIELKSALENVGTALGVAELGPGVPGSGTVASGTSGANALKTIAGLAQSPTPEVTNAVPGKANTVAEAVPGKANTVASIEGAEAVANTEAEAVKTEANILGGYKRTRKRLKSRKGKTKRKTKKSKSRKSKRSSNKKR